MGSKKCPDAIYIIKFVISSCFVSLSVCSLVALLMSNYIVGFDPGFDGKGKFEIFVSAVIFAPFIETIFMGIFLSGLMALLSGKRSIVVIMSAALWAVLHGFFFLAWGVVTFFSFAVFSFVFLRFMDYGWRWGFLAAFATHALHNLAAVSLGGE